MADYRGQAETYLEREEVVQLPALNLVEKRRANSRVLIQQSLPLRQLRHKLSRTR